VLPIAIGTGAEAAHEHQDIMDLEPNPEDLPDGDLKGIVAQDSDGEPPWTGPPGHAAARPPSAAPSAGSASKSGETKIEDPSIVADRGERKGPPAAPVLAGLEDKGENYPYKLPSIETWRNLMIHDLQYRILILYMQGKYTPKSITQMDALKRAVGFYKLVDDLLYYRLSRKDGKESQLLVVPEVSRRIIVMLYHNHHLTGGHRGWKTVKSKIQERYFWPNMNEDVKHYVGNCADCFWAKVKPNAKAGLMVDFLTNVGKFEVCHIDFVGPLPIKSQAGNKFILTMKCRGTGWIELQACPDQTAVSAARILYSEWICKYGVPKIVISDRGAPFKSALMKCLSKFMLMDMRQTTSYHPQTNGALERDHKTLKMYLRSSCLGTPSTWDTFLPSFRFTMNTTARDRLSYSAYFLLFGCHPRLPGDNRQTVIEGLDAQVMKMLTGLEEAGRIMLQERKENYDRLKIQYDKAHFALSYPIGAVVFKWAGLLSGSGGKFYDPFHGEGPWTVVAKQENGINYNIQNSEGKVETVHVGKLCQLPDLDLAPYMEDPELKRAVPDGNALARATYYYEKVIKPDVWKDKYKESKVARPQEDEDWFDEADLKQAAEAKAAARPAPKGKRAPPPAPKEKKDPAPDHPREQKDSGAVLLAQPLKQHSSVSLGSSEELNNKFVICAGTPLRPNEEFLFKLEVEGKTITGFRYRPVHEKDSGVRRQYAQSWWCGEHDNTHTVTSAPKETYQEDTEILERSRILIVFDALNRRKIPEPVYKEFDRLYGRKPNFTLNP